jgi:hypothetical protein
VTVETEVIACLLESRSGWLSGESIVGYVRRSRPKERRRGVRHVLDRLVVDGHVVTRRAGMPRFESVAYRLSPAARAAADRVASEHAEQGVAAQDSTPGVRH